MSDSPQLNESGRIALHSSDLSSVMAAALDAWVSRQGALLSIKEADSGRYVHVNNAMAALLGHPAENIPGRTDAELVDALLAANWRAADQAALAHAQPVSSEQRFEWAGARHEFNVLRVALLDRQGQRWL